MLCQTLEGTRQIVGKSVHGGCSGRAQYGLFSEGGTFKLRIETEGGRADINADLLANFQLPGEVLNLSVRFSLQIAEMLRLASHWSIHSSAASKWHPIISVKTA